MSNQSKEFAETLEWVQNGIECRIAEEWCFGKLNASFARMLLTKVYGWGTWKQSERRENFSLPFL